MMTKLTRLAALPMLTVGLAWSTGCDVMTEEAEDLAAGDGDSPNAMVSEVSASAKNQELEAWRYSTLKKSTLDSSTPSMKEADKCRIEAKTRVRISNVVMVGRHFRGTLTESIPACQSKPNFAKGQEVYVFRDHFKSLGASGTPVNNASSSSGGGSSESESPPGDIASLPTCSPKRAKGAVNFYEKAVLNTIAFAEGTAGRGQDGYNVGFGYNLFSSCRRHPDTVWRTPGYASAAAGRYQFMPATWAGLRLATFEPENQERGGIKLVERRGVMLPSGRSMTSTEFSNAMRKIANEWASIPGNSYGQPVKTMSELRATYCANAGC